MPSATSGPSRNSGPDPEWWVLSLQGGIGAVILLVTCLLDGTAGPNRYGPSPRGAAA